MHTRCNNCGKPFEVCVHEVCGAEAVTILGQHVACELPVHGLDDFHRAGHWHWRESVEELWAEVTRLRAQLQPTGRDLLAGISEVVELRAERDTLVAERLDQAAVHEWSVRNFGETPQTLVTLGLAEEVGELCRAVLKREQNIRATREVWDAEIRKEIGDCVIKLLDIAAYEGLDLVQVFHERWARVSQRDWVANPAGHGLPGGTE